MPTPVLRYCDLDVAPAVPGRLVTLRPFERCHLDVTRAWLNDAALARLLDRGRPVTPAEHENWFTALPTRTDLRYFAIHRNRDRAHIGNVWLAGIDWRHRKAEVWIVIGSPDGPNNGLGTEAIDLVCRFGFDHMGLRKVSAQVLAYNPRARRAFEKAGFTLEGTLVADRLVDGRPQDVWVLGRIHGHR